MADTVIPQFLNRLEYMLIADVDSLHEVVDQLWSLHSTLTRLTPFLTEVTVVEREQNDEDLVEEEEEEDSKKAMEVIRLVHDAETITDKYLYTPRQISVRKFGSEIKRTIQSLKELHKWFFETKESSNTSRTSSPSPSPSVMEDVHIVQQDEVTRLRDMLTKDEDDHGCVRLTKKRDHAGGRDVITVVGPRGLGKTTFVRKVFNHPMIVEHFPCRSWTYVSSYYKVEVLLQDILNQITAVTEEMSRKMKKSTIKELAIKTYKHLKTCSTRYLVVFDNVCDVNFWPDIEMIFPAKNKSGSRIIIITPHDEVASHARPSRPPFYLRRLSKEESRALLNRLGQVGEDVGVDGCVGLPLAIIELAAGLHRRLHSSTSGINLDKMRELIYNGLPSHLRQCLAYFVDKTGQRTAYPYFDCKGLMVVEGLVKSPPPSLIQSQDRTSSSSSAPAIAQVVAEDIAEEYLDELINMNLIKVQKKSFDGRIKEITIPHWSDSLPPSDRLRFYVADFSKMRRSAATPAPAAQMSSKVKPTKSSEVCSLSHRALDVKIEDSLQFPRIPKENRIHLRYLRLDLCNIRTDQQDLDQLKDLNALYNLQFLKIKLIKSGPPPSRNLRLRSYNLQLQFWKMRQLRHLSFRLTGDTTSTSLILDPQLVLNGTNGDGSVPILNNLQTLESLDTQFYEQGSEDFVWSSMMPNLVTLRVQGDINDRIARGFPLLGRLRKLKLVGEYKSSSSRRSNNLEIFPPNITHLSLQDTRFHGAYLMRSLQKLQNLRSLKLKRRCINMDESKVLDFGQSEINDDGLFRQLKFLKLKEIDMKKWEMSEEVMPSLQKVAVSSCQELEGLPIEALEAIPTLQELEVDGKSSEGVLRDATLMIVFSSLLRDQTDPMLN